MEIENVEEYPRPPALEPVPQEVRIVLAGQEIARTARALRVLETYHAPTYYLPPDDVSAVLRAAQGKSFCEWKGAARYWDVVAGETVAAHAAWSYEAPTQRFAGLAGYVAFYAGPMGECRVGDDVVVPQPGDFYGGWTTSNLRGRIKGASGTRHW